MNHQELINAFGEIGLTADQSRQVIKILVESCCPKATITPLGLTVLTDDEVFLKIKRPDHRAKCGLLFTSDFELCAKGINPYQVRSFEMPRLAYDESNIFSFDVSFFPFDPRPFKELAQ